MFLGDRSSIYKGISIVKYVLWNHSQYKLFSVGDSPIEEASEHCFQIYQDILFWLILSLCLIFYLFLQYIWIIFVLLLWIFLFGTLQLVILRIVFL
jgi:hypothetical protein